MTHIYTITVETNDDPAYHPYTVTVTHHGAALYASSGPRRKTLLTKAVDFINEHQQIQRFEETI